MQNVKKIIHEIADQLPEEATLKDVMRTLCVRQKLERARQAAQEGRVTSQEDAKKRFLGDAR